MNLEEERKAAVTAAAYVKEAALAVTKAIAWYAYAAKSAAETAADYETVSKAAIKKATDEAKHYENSTDADYYNGQVNYPATCGSHSACLSAAAKAATQAAAVYAEASARVASANSVKKAASTFALLLASLTEKPLEKI